MSNCPKLLLDHYEDPFHRGGCEQATHAAEAACPESGCQLRIELVLSETGTIVEAWFDGSGCRICEGTASLLVQHIQGGQSASYQRLTPSQLLQEVGLVELSIDAGAACLNLPHTTLLQALNGSLTELDDDIADGTQFGGPSLREEC